MVFQPLGHAPQCTLCCPLTGVSLHLGSCLLSCISASMDLVLLVCPCGEMIRAFALSFSPPFFDGLLDVTPFLCQLYIHWRGGVLQDICSSSSLPLLKVIFLWIVLGCTHLCHQTIMEHCWRVLLLLPCSGTDLSSLFCDASSCHMSSAQGIHSGLVFTEETSASLVTALHICLSPGPGQYLGATL